MYPYYILELRNTKLHLLHVYLGVQPKIETVTENEVCKIVGHCYCSLQALSQYILFNARKLCHM